ncbi:hypothetical protein H4S08_001597 [Coemansia sp. RSA 1365]|nr:hypothetical protein H4S08_001597 [Coemansia sp. RSA 1365]
MNQNKQQRGESSSAVGRRRGGTAAAGTVAALRPAAALTVREGITITEAAQLMAAKRADSVLVVDDDERLAGIFTAKDVAFRVVAEGLDARTTRVREIATREPLCVTSDTAATEALNTMVGRGFRHLPVCNEEGDVVGLLDIIRCMYEALEKMERAHQSSKALYAALAGVEKEWSVHSEQMMTFVATLRERMGFPDMTTVLDGADPVAVGPKTPVVEIARLMRSARVTASLVVDDDTGALAGIFTSKDIVLRVVAAGLDPHTCSVVRVMTPHPDTVPPSTTLIDALKRMYERHYLNLPIVDDAGDVLGVVDVLRLCYATLEQMKSIQGAPDDGAAGPMWSRFFSGNLPAELGGPPSDIAHAPPSFVGSARMASEVHPNESASMVQPNDSPSMAEDIQSAVNSRVGEQQQPVMPIPYDSQHPALRFAAQQYDPQQHYPQYDQQHYQQHYNNQPPYPYSNIGSQTVFGSHPMPHASSAIGSHAMPHAPSATGSGSMLQSLPRLNALPDGHFAFKLKTPAGNTHRFTAPVDDVDHVRMACVRKLLAEGLRDAQAIVDESGLAYVDDDGDFVHITGSADLADAVDLATREGRDRVTLQLNPRALAFLDEKDKPAPQLPASLAIPERLLVPAAVGGGFVTALFCVWLAVKLSKN